MVCSGRRHGKGGTGYAVQRDQDHGLREHVVRDYLPGMCLKGPCAVDGISRQTGDKWLVRDHTQGVTDWAVQYSFHRLRLGRNGRGPSSGRHWDESEDPKAI